MKSCSNPNCSATNPQSLDNFYKNKFFRDGLQKYCKDCVYIASVAWRKANLEKNRVTRKAKSAAHYKANSEKVRALSAAYYKANSEKVKTVKAKYRRANIDKARAISSAWKKANLEKAKLSRSNWAKANKDKVNAHTANRRARKLQRTPPWLTKDQKKENNAFYTLTKELQWLSDPTDPLTVDHIVPLQGENVSGLHVPWNLQIIPRSQNSSKKNKIQ